MKWLFISLPILMLKFFIGSNELSSKNNLIIEQRESYDACIRLRNKAPYFNLKCEHLLDKVDKVPIIETVNKKGRNNNNGITTLSIYEFNTRKVSKREENKLRNLIQKLSNKNKLRKD